MDRSKNDEGKANLANRSGPPPANLTATEALATSKTVEANKESDTKPKAKPPTDFEKHPEQLVAYEQGRAARRASIAVDDAPFGEGKDLEAWLAGYGFEDKALG